MAVSMGQARSHVSNWIPWFPSNVGPSPRPESGLSDQSQGRLHGGRLLPGYSLETLGREKDRRWEEEAWHEWNGVCETHTVEVVNVGTNIVK